MNIAFLIIDVQKAFVGKRLHEEHVSMALDYINYTADLFRAHEKPVFVIRDIEEGDGEDYQNLDELIVKETDIQLTKKSNNSFWQTNLEAELKQRAIDFLVLSGNALEYCVTATYFGALERGFKTVFLQNGIIAEFKESLDIFYKQRPLISYTALKELCAVCT